MERKLAKILEKKTERGLKNEECICLQVDYTKLSQPQCIPDGQTDLHQKISNLTQANCDLEAKLECSQNIITHLTNEIKSVFDAHQTYKIETEKEINELKNLVSTKSDLLT